MTRDPKDDLPSVTSMLFICLVKCESPLGVCVAPWTQMMQARTTLKSFGGAGDARDRSIRGELKFAVTHVSGSCIS